MKSFSHPQYIWFPADSTSDAPARLNRGTMRLLNDAVFVGGNGCGHGVDAVQDSFGAF